MNLAYVLYSAFDVWYFMLELENILSRYLLSDKFHAVSIFFSQIVFYMCLKSNVLAPVRLTQSAHPMAERTVISVFSAAKISKNIIIHICSLKRMKTALH